MTALTLTTFTTIKPNAKNLTNPINDKIVFIGNDINESTLELVKNKIPKDESLKNLESLINTSQNYSLNTVSNIEFLNNESTNYSLSSTPNLTSTDEIAAKFETVKNDITLTEYLKSCISKGVKVYLYGDDISLYEYKELLDLDEIFILKTNSENSNDKIKLEFGLTEDEIIKSKTATQNIDIKDLEKDKDIKDSLKKGVENGNKIEEKETFNVIGYDLDGENNKLVLTKIDSYTEENKEIKKDNSISNELFLSDILNAFYDTKTKDNDAKRSIVYVTEAPSYVHSTAVINGTTAGKTTTDWYMKRESSEYSTTFDYFSLEEKTSFVGQNNYGVRAFGTDHDIPYIDLGDRIYDWKPDQSDTADHNISLNLGAGGANLNYSFSTGSKYKVDDIGSRELSYGRWDAWSNALLPPTSVSKWYPATSWLSTGTTAVIDIRTKGKYAYRTPLSGPVESSVYIRCVASNYGSNNK